MCYGNPTTNPRTEISRKRGQIENEVYTSLCTFSRSQVLNRDIPKDHYTGHRAYNSHWRIYFSQEISKVT